MKLDVLTREQVQGVRKWRNNELQFLRTPYMITEKMQDEFFDNVINNRESKHRYFAIVDLMYKDINVTTLNSDTKKYIEQYPEQIFIGMGGLTNIEWENGTAEISLIINPDYRGKGYGADAVDILLGQAFLDMRLYSVYGEVYDCGNRGFWEKIVGGYGGYSTNLIDRKFFDGEFHDSMWFSISKEIL